MQQSSGSNALLVLPHPRLQLSMSSIVYLRGAEVSENGYLKKRHISSIPEKLKITKERCVSVDKNNMKPILKVLCYEVMLEILQDGISDV